MSFSKIHDALDPKTKSLFIKFVTAKGYGHQYGMLFGNHSAEALYKGYIRLDAPNRKGFSGDLLREMRKGELLAQHDITTQQNTHPDAITARQYSESVFIQSVMKEALKECSTTLAGLYALFIKSKAYQASVRKSIDGAKMAKDLKLPTSSETDLLDGAVATVTGNIAAAKKAAQSIVKKQGSDLPKQLNSVQKMAAAIEANVKKNGFQPTKPK